MILIVLLIVAVVVLAIKNNDLSNEIIKLKNDRIKYCPQCGCELDEFNPKVAINKNVVASNVVVNNKVIENKKVVEKNKYSDVEIKNNAILITGAIMIVIAAIVLLTSTWDVSHDLVKTLIISSLFVVFLGASYIADKVLKIKQTAKIFLYIALAYLPLVFLSASIFSLFGNYLSIKGEGRYIYLSIASIIISFIYYYVMRYKNDIFLGIASYFMQFISVILLVMMIDKNILLVSIGVKNIIHVLIGLILFLIVYNLLFKYKKYYYNEKVHRLINLIMGVASIVSIMYFYPVIHEKIYLSYIFLLIFIYINGLILLVFNEKKKELFQVAGCLLIMYIFYILGYMSFDKYTWYQILIGISIIVIYIQDLLVDRKLCIMNFFITNGIYFLIYLGGFSTYSYLPNCVIIFILWLSMLLGYLLTDRTRDEILYILPAPMFIFLLNLVLEYELETVMLIVVYLLAFIFSNIYVFNNKKIHDSLNICSIIFSILSYMICTSFYDNLFLTLVGLFFVLVYYLLALFKNNNIYKIISYIFVYFMVLRLLGINSEGLVNIWYAPGISILLIMFMDIFKKDDNSYIILLIGFIYAYFSMMFCDSLIGFILYILVSIVYILFIKINNKSIYHYFIPIISYNIFSLITWDIGKIFNINSFILITGMLTIILLVLLVLYKDDKYIYLNLINIFVLITQFIDSSYVKAIMLIICFMLFFINSTKFKDGYKFFMYIFIAALINLILSDLELIKIPVIWGLLYISLLIVITRDILKKHFTWYKIIEYIGLVILYCVAIGMYNNEVDGMIFVLLLLVLSILGYNKKWGPIFIISLVFILVNAFLLTRWFWLSLPWWLYLLLIGIILIIFAITNELREKQNSSNKIKETLKKIDL